MVTAFQGDRYGETGPPVVLIHGGPGAPGYLAPLAQALADSFQVWEPWQRGAGALPLTVERHVQDLAELVRSMESPAAPILLGHSWGAMLALVFAAQFPKLPKALILVACGTFDERARRMFERNLEYRMTEPVHQELSGLPAEDAKADEALARMGELLLPIFSVDLIQDAAISFPLPACDAQAHRESWQDMLRLQQEGRYPAAFQNIACPVWMIHGAEDPHPGGPIRDSLRPVLPQLEYREWPECGHYPWLERQVREDFLAELKTRLAEFAGS